jgi:hypothetical protein
MPIDYGYFVEMDLTSVTTDRHLKQIGLTQGVHSASPAQRLIEAESLQNKTSKQLLGYAGRLTFNPQYRGELAALKARWETLLAPPDFPLKAGKATGLSAPVVEDATFSSAVDQFLQKWSLLQLVTWDLPQPQGPLESVPLRVAARLLNPDLPVTAYPPFYDIPSDHDVRGGIRDMQRRAAREAGIELEHPVTDTSARGRAASGYESAFRLWLVERAVRSRYGSLPGLVACLTRVYSDLLGCSTARVKQLRRLYIGFLDE